jgi:hypothetical protein
VFFTVRCIFKTKFVSVTITAFKDITILAKEVSAEMSGDTAVGVGLV